MTRFEYPDCQIKVMQMIYGNRDGKTFAEAVIIIEPPQMEAQICATIEIEAGDFERFQNSFISQKPFTAVYAFETKAEKVKGKTIFESKLLLDEKHYPHLTRTELPALFSALPPSVSNSPTPAAWLECHICGGKVFHFPFCPKFRYGEKIV